ncbi:MAG: 30S ribosomal protein S15 [Ezakiella sp.]|nr:30S ribosomal protein S15 [Ezakiella sp.]MDD7471957.1 30S ribosomal protein S15 [Bacillota bacterium]MDY3923921.1 30S ribosomal protein S15 [Ezakiella sp.]
MIKKEKKTAIIEKYQKHEGDTGSTAVQIAILTARINEINEHLKKNPKDHHGRRGLLMMVGKRKGLMKYLQNTNLDEYRDLIADLGIRG